MVTRTTVLLLETGRGTHRVLLGIAMGKDAAFKTPMDKRMGVSCVTRTHKAPLIELLSSFLIQLMQLVMDATNGVATKSVSQSQRYLCYRRKAKQKQVPTLSTGRSKMSDFPKKPVKCQ